MPFANRSDLRTSVQSWLMRPGDSELSSAVLNDIIAMMEADAFRRLDLTDVETRDDSFAISGAYTDLPTGFKGFRRAPRLDTGVRLRLVDPTQMDDEIDPTSTGDPYLYCIEANQIRVGPAPSGTGRTLDITYFGTPSAITDATANFLLTNHPDLYLYGSLKHSAPFIGEDGRMALWEAGYEKALATIAAADRRKKWSAGGEMRVAGATP